MENQVLTQEELQALKNFQSQEENLVIAFGQVAYKQQILDEQQDELIENKLKFDKERNNFASSLTSKYGDGTINMETGEIISTP